MSVLSLSHVTVSFSGRAVLSDISLEIGQGQFIGVLGPNGGGKSTLMRVILGLVRPDCGAVQVLGAPATRGNAALGYLPQSRGAVASLRLRGWDFVASASNGQRWGLPVLGKAAMREVQWALDTVGAAGLAQRPLAEISGGERQRLLLAQALLGRPRLLLLDEPLISLDPHYQRVVVELIKRIQQEFGITVLFSAHELNPLLNVIDQVLYLGSGQAVLGKVDEVITGPVLSRLYGSPIDVVRLKERIFVMSGEVEVEKEAHAHHA
ncbi:zinc/manganese transport system ATP-binding protein [Pollutimonas bauzanensis]|uniref:Zinc/manganese transport system ATP-binding protein n=1 Tax=Pollutimonas bauzanensis TaxID=658167 RepID=A0A1M5Z380_9BURK|nr:zinc/manganese transport system ATP-binding protein [Pollutimonas bauzanensis]